MRIVSWNINGIRAVARKELFLPIFSGLQPDVLLLQETKAKEVQLPDHVLHVEGYHAYFHAPVERSGYSGTALYSRREPLQVTYGMGIDQFDAEGRMVTAFFEDLIVVNIYFPNGGQGPERLRYKLEFYDAFLAYIGKLGSQKPVVWAGDVNTAHEAIDLARPKENEGNTGFLPEERAWLDEVEAQGWVDTFRHLFPNKTGAYTYWDMKTRARDRNVGWRIDYIFISPHIVSQLTTATIHQQLLGSDHCPISIDLRSTKA